MAAERLAVTRLELLRARRRLERVWKGAELLRKRREALARELIRIARPAVDARSAVAHASREACNSLYQALTLEGATAVRALAWPARSLGVEMRFLRVWGVPVADITLRPQLRRTLEARGHAPASTGFATENTAARFEELVELLLDAAPRELLLRRLGAALARTSRQVHALEKNVAPALQAQIVRVRGSLDEREREEHHRLKHFLRIRSAASPVGPTPSPD